MSIIRTDRWLLDSYDNPIEMCEKITPYFDDESAYDIYQYLTIHGMYRPLSRGVEQVKDLQNNGVWKMVERELRILQKYWGGPDIPVFIFPSESTNRTLIRNFNRKSGLAFHDKIFLFISPENKQKEINALLTHEYNHVCRLMRYDKKEKEYVLLDTIIMEGLAEHAVFEKYGEDYVARWTSNYSENMLEKMWQTHIFPNRNLSRTDRKYERLLFGLANYPTMLGYCVGYYLINNYSKKTNLKSKDLLTIDSSMLAQLKE
ncbi:DUF2268 domain-containing protein [Oceanobacillus chungangensis]|uniref:Zn-dependent protease n=1 Tax=Oceanobacillus chungangensis TaxID=1229152 RepID=A0A3D8PKY4_9BACI|nr:DUF2268 domain-containing putative Zn-dependent protease [Oceanobacillus chungangensis]RDW15888.1 Zn-dependent protease [Oceanobacillus chungangensis]